MESCLCHGFRKQLRPGPCRKGLWEIVVWSCECCRRDSRRVEMSEPWDSHQEEWKHRVGKGDLHGTTAGRTGGETTQALWNLANFTTSPRCWRWSYRMWWLPVVFALALIWLFFVMFWSQNAYLTPCLSYFKPLLLCTLNVCHNQPFLPSVAFLRRSYHTHRKRDWDTYIFS